MKRSEKWIIVGPCALESEEHLKLSVSTLQKKGFSSLRASLWKPRTRPGWEGSGEMALPLLLKETIPHGIIPATEIIISDHAQSVVDALVPYGQEASMIVWLGSRNQNHLEQKKMAKILLQGPKNLFLMFKNQMWEDEAHWLGIYEHLLEAGFPKERLLVCHRGFSPGKSLNPRGLRNIPDFEMAMRIKEKTSLPMFLDPSHIGGSPENICDIFKESLAYDFDGYLIETHIDPKSAKTDAKQQLTPHQLEELLLCLN